MNRSLTFLAILFAILLVLSPSIRADGQKAEFDHKPNEKVGSTTDSETAGQKFTFQAEVNRLMDIIIHSLYSNREIFLRELISNASDALDKIRFVSLTNPEALGEGDAAQLEIRISSDKDAKTLTIRDTGIGMTRDELIANLGTIAKSGTSQFLEKMSEGADVSLIGQFGVGFYSAFLVSERVVVRSKSNSDPQQWVWESTAEDSFSVYEDTTGEPLSRGSSITLHLREDATEYLEQEKLREIVKKYSEFINFPIYLHVSEEVDVEVPADEESTESAETKTEKSDSDEIDVEDLDEETASDDTPKTKTVKETRWKWEHVNENKAIWTRDPSEIEHDEYVAFYRALTKREDDPARYTHFKAEGEVEFRSILYIPGEPPVDMFDNYNTRGTGIKLYVRRVLITDQFDDLMPKYLNFIRGVVDSDDLPINVSREMLQESRILKVIKKKLVRKALEMFKKIAEAEERSSENDEEDEENDGEAGSDITYKDFFNKYGKAIKLGVIEDPSNRARLAKLLRFFTSKSTDAPASLDAYIERMKEGQKAIYFVSGESLEVLRASPFVEKLLKNDYEVLYLIDPLDEYVFQQLTEYEGHKFQSATKEGLKLGDEDSDENKEKEKKVKEVYKPLTKFIKDELSSKLEKVVVSHRLSDSPCVLVTSQYGWSANMERIMKAQALNDPERYAFMSSRKTMELNPFHPIVKQLLMEVKNGNTDKARDTVQMMYESALLQSGFSLEDPNVFAKRMFKLLASGLGVDPEAKADEADTAWIETEVEKEEDDKDEL